METATSILRQLDDQCRTWSNQHDASCTLLASLLNITRQREYTQKQLTDRSAHPSHVASSSHNTLPFGPRSLELLIHQQSLEIESVIQQLLNVLKALQQVVDQMTILEHQAETLVRQQHPATAGHSTLTSPPCPPNERGSSSSNSTLASTAAIAPLQTLEWTHRVRDMYHAEYQIKRAQLTQNALSQALERYESLEQLYRQWSQQRRIDFGLEQEIKERLDTLKRIQDYANLIK